MSESINTSFSINLGSAGQKTFLSLDEFNNWLKPEREFWTPFLNLDRSEQQIVQALHLKVSRFYEQLSRIQSTLDNATTQAGQANKQIVAHFDAAAKQHSCIFSQSSEGRFLAMLLKENPSQIGRASCRERV